MVSYVVYDTFGGHVKRCVSLSARRLDINMTLNQQPHYLEVAYMCGEVQGRLALAQVYISRNLLENLTLQLGKRNFPKSYAPGHGAGTTKKFFRNLQMGSQLSYRAQSSRKVGIPSEPRVHVYTQSESEASQVMGRSVTRVTDRPKRTHADQRTQKASTPLAQALLLPCSTATHHSTAAHTTALRHCPVRAPC